MMKESFCLVIVLTLFLFGCASQTMIHSIPEKAKVVTPEGKIVGVTPYYYWDRDISGSETFFILKSNGYKDQKISIKKDKFNFSKIFFPPLLALPWIMGYESEYYFEMEEKDKSPAMLEASK